MSDKMIQTLSGIAILVRVYIALVFITAGFPKIVTPHDFALSVATYQILPLPFINLFSIIIPWVELLAGILLLIGLWIKPSSLVIFGLMIMFIIALSIALAKGLDIKCGCFASADAADEMDMLKSEADYLKKSLDAINARIDALEKKPAE